MKLSVTEASRKHDIFYGTIAAAIKAGKIPAKKERVGKGRPKFMFEESDLLEWHKLRGQDQPKKIKEIKPCRLPEGTAVEYIAREESRENEKKRGRIKKVYPHHILIENINGYSESFTHFDYKEGEFQTV